MVSADELAPLGICRILHFDRLEILSKVPEGSPLPHRLLIVDSFYPFDELIVEFGHVHRHAALSCPSRILA